MDLDKLFWELSSNKFNLQQLQNKKFLNKLSKKYNVSSAFIITEVFDRYIKGLRKQEKFETKNHDELLITM